MVESDEEEKRRRGRRSSFARRRRDESDDDGDGEHDPSDETTSGRSDDDGVGVAAVVVDDPEVADGCDDDDDEGGGGEGDVVEGAGDGAGDEDEDGDDDEAEDRDGDDEEEEDVEEGGDDDDGEIDADRDRRRPSSSSRPDPADDDPEEEEEGEEETCSHDLRNLVASNPHQIDVSELYRRSSPASSSSGATNVAIRTEGVVVVPDEDVLLRKAREGCSNLLDALWDLPTERSDSGPTAILPGRSETKIPRALPPPPPKAETKWEKFAKERGIGLRKEKRSRKVWDEASGTWMYRHGYQKANADSSKEWPIAEVKGNENPYDDPWEKVRDAKRAEIERNVENRMRNQERASAIPRGTTTRTTKSKREARERGKAGGNADRDNATRVLIPGGVPADLATDDGKGGGKGGRKRGKGSTRDALVAAQRSTASLGTFDAMREGEPERKRTKTKKKRNVDAAANNGGSGADRKTMATEAERGMKIYRSVVADGRGGGAGSKTKERMRRDGRLSRGETALDYDFDDGLSPSSFRKKKGRAGAGKMKKMTKKRAK